MALEKGAIRSLDDPVVSYVKPRGVAPWQAGRQTRHQRARRADDEFRHPLQPGAAAYP